VKEKQDAKRRGNFMGENKAVLLASGVIAAAAFISFVVILLLNGAPPLQPRERVMLTDYEEVHVSWRTMTSILPSDSPQRWLENFGDWMPVSSSVQLISKSDSLESARKAFAKLSQEAVRYGNGKPTLWRANSVISPQPRTLSICQS
jgi:hypothetical protein